MVILPKTTRKLKLMNQKDKSAQLMHQKDEEKKMQIK
jgi:hypothetical protein